MTITRLACVSALVLQASVAFAQGDKRMEIISTASALKYAVLAERGDVWVATLVAENGRCGRSKADKDYRARVLARRYDNLVQATFQAKDADLIVVRAKELSEKINASTMYQSCWKTMVNRADLVANTGDILVRVIKLGG